MNIQIPKINTSKNLLAFSAGVDSTALFFILLENSISFDIAIVNYNLREESKQEVEYAKKLAFKYNKKIFVQETKLSKNSNFEKKARDIRYSFFEQIIKENSYETLITAHQLNDKLEWFLMQLSKGAGLVELLGFNIWEERENYKIFKPLLDITKKSLEEYLNDKKHKYFIDKTNFDEEYRRNYFRKNFSNRLLEEFEDGIKKSFSYLQEDLNSLNIDTKPILATKKLTIYKSISNNNLDIRVIDKDLKKRGFLLSYAQREEIVRVKELVISAKIAISYTKNFIFIAPYIKKSMPKEFKESCRLNKIPKNIRAYIFNENLLEEVINISN